MKRLLVCLAVAGCAQAGKGNSIIGGLGDAGMGPHTDADDVPEPDASPIDAPPQQVTLSQTVSGTIELDNSFACSLDNKTDMNSYFRVFTLADYNITTTLHVFQIEFAIQSARGGQGPMQPATVRIGTYGVAPTGTTLDPAQIRPLRSLDIQIPDGMGTRMPVPIEADIPPTTSVIVELAIPDGTDVGNVFFIGTNSLGERQPAYTTEPNPSCGAVTVPTTMQSIADKKNFGNVDIIMTVTGTAARRSAAMSSSTAAISACARATATWLASAIRTASSRRGAAA